MNSDTASKIYEWASYVLVLGATVLFFAMKGNPLRFNLTLIALVAAEYMRVLMYRSRSRAAEGENEELKRDLRRLTALLAEEKEKKK
ncbi:MAG: hypothetical protein SPJ13_06295 [Bacteroidales bacterium]|nr:hypothetical protein [Bacteroidales bacterium]